MPDIATWVAIAFGVLGTILSIIAIFNARRANALAAGERWSVEWTARWDYDTAVLTLSQDGRDSALATTVEIIGDEIKEQLNKNESVAHGGVIRIPLPQVPVLRKEYEDKHRDDPKEIDGTILIESPWGDWITIIIAWETGMGKQQTKRIERFSIN